MEEELRAVDYWERPLAELMRHPDYNPHVHRVVQAIMEKTSAQLEQLDITGDK